MTDLIIELQKIVKAWEALPGGRDYSISIVQDWLVNVMKPAIDDVRFTLDKERVKMAPQTVIEGNSKSLKDCVTGRVKFQYYRKGELWYVCENGFEFPVPINDTGDASFYKEDKAMLFMRWIKKWLETVNKEKDVT